MSKCKCFQLKNKPINLFNPATGESYKCYETLVGVCSGTRELDECNCNGDRCKCDFYPEIRIEANKEKSKDKYYTKLNHIITTLNNLDDVSEFKRSKEDVISKLMDVRDYLRKENM